MSHRRIAKTKIMIYWKTDLKWILKTSSLNKPIEMGNKTRIDRGLQLFNFHFAKTR